MKSPRSGSALLETAMWVPILVLLLMGMVELARVSYTYFTLHKILYAIARGAGTLQGANFCDSANQAITDIKNFALQGAIEDTGTTLVPNLTADQIAIRIERFNVDSDALEECECSDTGCDTASGGTTPDFLVVSLPEGYSIRLIFPGFNTDPFLLRPQIRIPYGGT